MENKIVPKEIKEIPKDIHYEYFRAIKTFCVIMIIFCIGLICKKDYLIMIQKAQYMRFYPKNTVFYADYDDIKEFNKVKLPKNVQKLSYGIFEDKNGDKAYLIVSNAATTKTDTILEKPQYFYFTNNDNTFYSNNKKELQNLQNRISTHDWEFVKQKNIKKSLKKLDNNRNSTLVIRDIVYTNFANYMKLNAKTLFPFVDTIIIQNFNDKDTTTFNGEITFKNKIINIILYAKNCLWHYPNKKITIQTIEDKNPVFIIGLKDFDILIKMLVQVTKNLDNKQYNETISLIQTIFNSNFEDDIIKKLSGNAVFYLYKNKNIYNKLLLVETNKNLSAQVLKYLNYLQLSDNISLTEKEIQNKTFNVLDSGKGNYNISFGSLNENAFIAGDQNIMERYIEANEFKITNKNCDIYIEADLSKIPFEIFENKNWDRLKLGLNIKRSITFDGELIKQKI